MLNDGRVVALTGRLRLPGVDVVHVLTRTNHPTHGLAPTPSGKPHIAEFIQQLGSGPRRPNLVVLCANETSLHPGWFTDLRPETRSWDCCINFYGRDPEPLRGTCEYLAHQPMRHKFQALYDLFYESSPLWEYDRIWFPDDDLTISGANINQLFHLTLRYGLDLAQPSLAPVPGCYINHPVTAQQPGGGLRYDGFVETMCPVFSRRALRICLGTFKDAFYAYGIDHLWPTLLGGPRSRIAIIDDVALVHTRPWGTNYDKNAGFPEEQAYFLAYDFRRLLPTRARQARRHDILTEPNDPQQFRAALQAPALRPPLPEVD